MKIRQIAALLLALLVACSGLAAAAEEGDVYLKVGNCVITVEEAQAYYDEMVDYYRELWGNYGVELEQEDVDAMADLTLQYFTQDANERLKIQEYGLDTITDEEKEGLREEAQEEFDNLREEAVGYYKSLFMTYYDMDEEQAAEQAGQMADKDMEESGYTVDAIYEYLLTWLPYERLYNHVVGDFELSNEEVDAEYEKRAAEQADMFNDIEAYETNTVYYGVESYYRPAGYRLVKYVLLPTPDEIQADMIDYETDMTSAEETLETLREEMNMLENQSSDSGETEPRTAEEIQADIDSWEARYAELKEAYDGLKKTVAESLQPTVDEVLGKAKAGETFESLILAYGADEEMSEEKNLADGIAIHPQSVIYDKTLCDAVAMLGTDGEIVVSEPSMQGIFIVKYVADLPGGAIPLTDEVRDELRAEMMSEMQAELYSSTVAAWIEENDGVTETYPEKLQIPVIEETESIG